MAVGSGAPERKCPPYRRAQASGTPANILTSSGSPCAVLRQVQVAQLECERATRFIAEQLKFVRPSQDTDVLELFQEVS